MPIRHQRLRKNVLPGLEPYPHPDKLKRIFDKAVMFSSFLAPLANFPQLYSIWVDKTAVGVSLISWIGFLAISFVWAVYGFLHNEKPIVVMNVSLFLVQLLVVIGVMIYK